MKLHDEKKDLFIDLLQASLGDHGEDVSLSEGILEENGLNGDTFWSVICPSLKKDDLLKSYNKPTEDDFENFFLAQPEYNAEIQNCIYLKQELSIERGTLLLKDLLQNVETFENEVKDSSAKIVTLRAKYSKNYPHKFEVNREKLLVAAGATSFPEKHIMITNTPGGANWRALQIRFTNGRTILVSFPMHSWNKSIGAGELGLEKKIGQRLMRQWELLEEASKDNGQIKLPLNGKEKESKRRQVNMLQKLLKEVFPNLKGEPFEPRGDVYIATFVIEPEIHEENDLQE